MGESVTRPMDRVLDAWSSGDHAGALRWAVPLLEAQPDSALALLATAGVVAAALAVVLWPSPGPALDSERYVVLPA